MYAAVLGKWAERMDIMTHARDRKLTGIAFATLIAIEGTPCISELLIVIASVVAESMESKLTRCGSGGVVYWMDHEEIVLVGEGQVLPPHGRRKVECRGRDVVYGVEVGAFVKGKVGEVLCGVRGDAVRVELGGEALRPLRLLLES
jgi:hypothetical protein